MIQPQARGITWNNLFGQISKESSCHNSCHNVLISIPSIFGRIRRAADRRHPPDAAHRLVQRPVGRAELRNVQHAAPHWLRPINPLKDPRSTGHVELPQVLSVLL